MFTGDYHTTIGRWHDHRTQYDRLPRRRDRNNFTAADHNHQGRDSNDESVYYNEVTWCMLWHVVGVELFGNVLRRFA